MWSEYIDPTIITDFEKRFNCKVVVDLYEDNDSMMAKLENGGSSVYDIAIPSDYVMKALKEKKLLAPLRKENIPNMANIADRFVSPPFDPGNEYSVPYQWGTIGIYMRTKPNEQITKSWALLYDPAKQPGPFVLIDSVRDAFSTVLKYRGYSLNTVDPEKLSEVQKILADAKKRSIGFDSGVGGKNKVLAGTARMSISFNGDAVRGMKDDPATQFFVPEEGSQIWIDSMVITSGAPHRDMAEKFLNFILDPEVGARLSNFNQYATPNKASMPHINKDDLANQAIYPSEEIMKKLEFLNDVGPASRMFDELWTELKSE
jgi:spermidine/putrescine transport system substrate-binding protein